MYNRLIEQISAVGKYLKLTIDTKGLPYSLHTNVKYGKIAYNEGSLVVKKYIKENEHLKIEAGAKNVTSGLISIRQVGYEVKVDIL